MKLRPCFDDLAPYLMRVNISPYEWRIMVFILSTIKKNENDCICAKLEEYQKNCGISIYHISRALKNLRLRNMVNMIKYRAEHYYSINCDVEKWKSHIDKKHIEVPPDIEKRFNVWWERYPRKYYREDAKLLYLTEINKGTKPEELDEALSGYAKHERLRAKRTGKEIDHDYIMFPTSFLRNGRWREFLEKDKE